jgi:hypothetical protein
MKNLPNYVSSSELESWKKWAQQSKPVPSQQKRIEIKGLIESPAQAFIPPTNLPWRVCNSCQRRRIT